MSRASDVRDAIANELTGRFDPLPVDKFLLPTYERASLESSSRIVIRNGGRELSLQQGADETRVIIQVGVVGIMPEKQSTDYEAECLAKGDEIDGVVEQLIALWMNRGALWKVCFAEHRLYDIGQAIQFDPDRLYKEGVYLSMIQLTYRDIEDE